MSFSNAIDSEKLITPIIAIIPLKYLDALLALNTKLKGKTTEWAVSGELGEALETVHAEPDCIEIVTSKEGAELMHKAVQEYTPQEIKQQTERLLRNAVIKGKEFSVNRRSYFFRFNIKAIEVKVYGDLQYQIADWGWGDRVEFKPNYVCVVGQPIAVMPLEVRYELYLGLGWQDRAAKIHKVLNRKYQSRHHFNAELNSN